MTRSYFAQIFNQAIGWVIVAISLAAAVVTLTNPEIRFPPIVYSTLLLVAVLVSAWRVSEKYPLVSVPEAKARRDYDVFLAAPMASLVSETDHADPAPLVQALLLALRRCEGLRRVYWAGDSAPRNAYDPPDFSLDDNLMMMRRSRVFVLLYHRELPTSALVEAGMALALRMPSVFLVKQGVRLPWLLRGVTQANAILALQYDFSDAATIAALVETHANDIIRKLRVEPHADAPVEQVERR